jgi:hypothetical protein
MLPDEEAVVGIVESTAALVRPTWPHEWATRSRSDSSLNATECPWHRFHVTAVTLAG